MIKALAKTFPAFLIFARSSEIVWIGGMNGKYFCPGVDVDDRTGYRRIIETDYLNIILKDNSESEAVTMHNQFGRLKSALEFTDYHHLTNQQLEDLLNNTRMQITQFSIDFSKLFFSYT